MNNFSIPINQTSSHTRNLSHIENFGNAKMGYALEQQKTRETSTSTTTHMRPAITPEIHRAPPNPSIDFVSDADWENRPQRFSSLCEKSGSSKMPRNDHTAQIRQYPICLCIVGNTINHEKNTYAKKEIQRGKFGKC